MATLASKAPVFQETYREIQQRILTLFLLVIGIATWVILIGANVVDDRLTAQHISFGVMVILVCVIAQLVKQYYFPLAVAFFVFGMWMLVAFAYIAWQRTEFAFLLSLTVLIAISLSHLRNALTIATLSTVILILGPDSIQQLSANVPIMFVWVTLTIGHISAIRGTESFSIIQTYAKYATEQMHIARDRRAELVKLTKSLREATENLDRTNSQLRYAREVAEEARRLKALFTASVSHELRTPINLIVGYSEVMALVPEAYGDALPVAYRADVQAIYRNGKHLQSLINDILDISQIEAERLAMFKEKTNPAQIIHEAASMVSDLVKSRGLDLLVELVDDLPELWLDRTRIRQVLLNLLANAIRFTETGCIRITAKVDAQNLYLSVSDTGFGIQQADLDKVFEEFFHHDRAIPNFDRGTGLGLALSKQFVKQHGGTIWVESEGVPGKGSCFTFTLPLHETLGNWVSGGATASAGKQFESLNQLLIIDNDPAIIQLFERYVHKGRLMHAADVASAERLITEVRPTAIVADGCFQDALSAIIAHKSPETVLMTFPMPSGKRVAQSQGIAEYLVKPISRQSLLDALESLQQPVSRVLIIDDDPDILRLFERMLRSSRQHFSIHQAMNGRKGIAAMQESQPDVVILDIVMPDIDGLSVLRYMKDDPDLCDIPVIVISARGLEEAVIPRIQGQLHISCPVGFQATNLIRYAEAVLDVFTPDTLQAP